MAGVQWVSYHILKSLPCEEYEKHILFSSDMDEKNKIHCKELFEGIGCKVFFLDSLKRSIGIQDIKAIKEIYCLCKKEKYDIVHTNSTKPGVVGRMGAKLANVPYIIHTIPGLAFHNFLGFPQWQFYWMCEMFSSLFSHKIAIVNKYYSRYFKLFKRKIITIYNGGVFPSQDNSIVEKSGNEIKILFVGRLSLPKDPLTMIRAFSLACSKKSDLSLTIVGDGEFFNECVKLVEELGIQDKVKFEGWKNEVVEYYKSHDLFITTSIYEAFGLVFLDAGYYKLPTIATNVEGIPEVIEDGMTGLLSAPRDIKSIANNIVKLANNTQLRQKMGGNAFNRVTELFTVEGMTDAYRKLYEEHRIHSKK